MPSCSNQVIYVVGISISPFQKIDFWGVSMILASAVPTIQVLTLHLDSCNRLAMLGDQCSVWLSDWAVGHILCYLFQMILQTHRIDINHFIPYHEQELIADVPSTKMETQLWMSEEQHITCRAVSPSQCRAQECSMFKQEWCRVSCLETKIIPNKIKCFDGKSRMMLNCWCSIYSHHPMHV